LNANGCYFSYTSESIERQQSQSSLSGSAKIERDTS
jgi:hypothetical protein